MLPTDDLSRRLSEVPDIPAMRDVDPAALLRRHQIRQRRRVAIAAALMVAATGGGLGLATGTFGNPKDRISQYAGVGITPTPTGNEGLAARTLATMTPEQRRIISKGPITLAEYYLVVGHSVDCLRANGFTVTEPVFRDGAFIYTTSHPASAPEAGGGDANGPEAVTIDAKVTACSRLSEAVAAVWYVDHPPTDGRSAYPGLRELVAELRAHP